MNAPTTGATVTTGATGAAGAGAARAAASPQRVAARVCLGVVIGTYLGDALSAFFPGSPAYSVVAVGSLLGLLLGLLTVRRRGLAPASLGLAAGAGTGLVANPVVPVAVTRTYSDAETFDYGYQPVVALVSVTVLGSALGQLVGRRPWFAKPVSGLVLGALAGHFASLAAKTGDGRVVADSAGPSFDLLDGAGHADILVSGYGFAHGYASAVLVTGGAVLGLLLGLVAERRRGLARPALGLALGALLGGLGVAAGRSMYAAFPGPIIFDDTGSPHSFEKFAGVGYLGDLGHGLAVVAGGAALGLLLGLLAERWHRLTTPLLGVAVGGVVGHAAGAGLRAMYSTSFDWPNPLIWSGGSEPVGTATSLVFSYGNGQVVAMLVGAVLGGVAGLLAGRRLRLLKPLAGLALGISTGSAVSAGYYDFVLLGSAPSYPGDDFPGTRIVVPALACVVVGLGAGMFAGWYPRFVRPALGLVFGALVGQTAARVAADTYLFAVDYTYNHPSDSRWAEVVGLLAGAAAGLVLGALADRRTRLSSPLLGLALGTLAGSAIGSDYTYGFLGENGHTPDAIAVYVGTAVVAGAVLGLLAGLLTARWPRQGRRALGALAGVFAGTSVPVILFGISPAVWLVLSGAAGAVVAAGGLGPSYAPSAGSTALRSSLPARQVVRLLRLLRPGTFAHGMVGLAAAIAASDGQQERYAEEFEATLVEVDGRLRRTRRLWCALTILAGAALLRAELAGEKAERRS
ncbi:hypothetical protein [Frankia sp. QA3]|uniref:hypothetical protein n=1 Tax=Frankia sp. QA3 TaxID=710111 RepID=UPI000269C422|nr:hypothetical protein [Frankia sp. QA3]EIV94306.1 hypothetical protein FraQA3DRAFT_4051 [Frankia sp. QA3]